MAGLGGDAFFLIWDAAERSLLGLNAAGRAAAAATPEAFASRRLRRVPTYGPLAAITVPGAVDGWARAHARLGRIAWADLLAPAIECAAWGFAVGARLAAALSGARPLLEGCAAAREALCPGGRTPAAGEVLAQPWLAASLRSIAHDGAAALYRGPLAERLAAACQAAGGWLTADDLARHQGTWVTPLRGPYHGYTVAELPPPTQGATALELLRVAEGWNVRGWGDGSVDYYHHLAEASRLASADRDRYLGDPLFGDVPVDWLTGAGRAAELRDAIRPDAVGGDPPARALGGDTVFICAVDADGNAVSLSESLFYGFGSGFMAGDTGIMLHNRGTFFRVDPGHPNDIAPGKQPLHTLIPAMVLDGERPVLCFGTMGGEAQPQIQAALLTRRLDFDLDVQAAIEAPRWHWLANGQAGSGTLLLENRIGPAVAARLLERGHDVALLPAWSEAMGHAQMIALDRAAGRLEGGADPRADGTARGW
jgi:gamma-glutamyltranspeptidase/glutathione hydrolase